MNIKKKIDMKKFLLFSLLMMVSVSSKGQFAKWLIEPKYDNIRIANGESVVIADSLGYKILWSRFGKRLGLTEDQVYPFKEGYAITTKQGSSLITGCYDKFGTFTSFSDCNVSYSMPFFSNGYLLVKEGGLYKFVNEKGIKQKDSYLEAYPYNNGYASCRKYRNPAKKKDPYNLLISTEGEKIVFSYNGKTFDDDDLDFISSVNDENVGIVVAKNKLYYFDGKERVLSPIFAREGESNRNNQAKSENDLTYGLPYDFVLRAKCGKNDEIQVHFDSLLIPVSITFPDGEKVYKKNIISERSLESPLKIERDGYQYGISWDGEEILPPQFDEVKSFFDDMAFVRLSGKWGMVKVMKDKVFKISINKDEPIGFRHKRQEAPFRLDLPKTISAKNTRVVVDPASGCDVQMTSAKSNDTEHGNYIEYNCVLNFPPFPPELPIDLYDDSRNEITYPIQIVYDNLRSPVIPHTIRAWHQIYFDVKDGEITFEQDGTMLLTFDINRDEAEVRPLDAEILTDSLQFNAEKITERHYKCRVYGLHEGKNSIVIMVKEDGCPSVPFPYEIEKPSAKNRNKSTVKKPVLRKKEKQTSESSKLDFQT